MSVSMTPNLPQPPAAATTRREDVPGGATAAEGYRASGIHCGIRKKNKDLAILVSDELASAAGVFTRNRLAAAPVALCREHLALSGGRARAVIINSGNANACTGPAGMEVSRRTAVETARALDLAPEQVLVCSTGVIGVPLPMAPLLAGIPEGIARLCREGSGEAAEAILTTDTCRKETAMEVTWEGGVFRVGGMAKGSGMIHPDMATTLAFVTTDAPVSPEALAAALKNGVDKTFNRISVDGDTSTNDAVLVLANGRAGGQPLEPGTTGYEAFSSALEEVLRRLALMVVTDGEGATRTMEVLVRGAASEEEAVRAARAVCVSPLVKTALHGADPNWGRLVSSVGATQVELDPTRLSVTIEGLEVLGPGFRSDFDEADASRRLSRDFVHVVLDLGAGDHEARAWTCDLTNGYIRINAEYRT